MGYIPRAKETDKPLQTTGTEVTGPAPIKEEAPKKDDALSKN